MRASTLKGRSFVRITDLDRYELRETLELARELKRRRKAGLADRPLAGKTLGLVFQKPSLRTRVSFAVGMTQLGGDVVYLSPDEVGLGKREAVDDVAIVLSRYFDVIGARVFGHDVVAQLAEHAEIPVINLLSDAEHPCQALADLLTIQEWLGRLEGVEVAYVGDGNNVAVSLGIGCAMSGAHFRIATPEGYALPREPLARFEEYARATGSRIVQTTDPKEAVAGAHVVYTDVWTSMGQEAEQAARLKAFAGFRVDQALLDLGDDPVLLHCLPAHYGEEITRDVTRGPRSAIWDQAENRLHAQKALLALVT